MVAVNAEEEKPLRWNWNRATGSRLALGLAILVLIGLSRLAAFPASIWEQDEAYFSAAVVEMDLADSRPHPPFFPLWIAFGKLVHSAGLPPAESLMLVSAVLSTVLLIPLTVLWWRLLGPGLAPAAAVVVLMVPGVWLYSGRAFSEIGATAFLVSALACWTRSGGRAAAWGSVAAGAAVLIRPQFGLVVVFVVVWLLVRRPRKAWPAIVAPAAILIVVGATWFAVSAGGLAEVLNVSSLHAAQHFGELSTADRGLFDSGLARLLVSPVVFLVWLGLTALGVFTTLAAKGNREVGWLVLAALTAMIIVVFGLSNPAHPRYAAPLVILSGGFVAAGLRRVLGVRGAIAGAGALVCWAVIVVLPSIEAYRGLPSPPIRALERASRLAAEREGVLVVDRTLHAFVGYREAVGLLEAPVLFDHMLKMGVSPQPGTEAVLIFDGDNGRRRGATEGEEGFSCDDPLLRSLGQNRFLDLTVARSTGSESPEYTFTPVGKGTSGRIEAQPVGGGDASEDDEGEEGLEGGRFRDGGSEDNHPGHGDAHEEASDHHQGSGR